MEGDFFEQAGAGGLSGWSRAPLSQLSVLGMERLKVEMVQHFFTFYT